MGSGLQGQACLPGPGPPSWGSGPPRPRLRPRIGPGSSPTPTPSSWARPATVPGPPGRSGPSAPRPAGQGRAGQGRAMSLGGGLVRTTCSSEGVGGPGRSSSEGLLDSVYPRTYPALMKVAQMVTLLIAFICVRSSAWTSYSAYSYFEVVTICNLIMILAFYLVHLFRIYRVLTCISWPLSELLHYVIGTLLLLIASIVAASKSYSQSGLVAGSIFGFVATFLCMASVWMFYKISCVTQSTDAAV